MHFASARTARLAGSLALALVVAACGGKASSTQTTPSTPESGSAATATAKPALPDVPFDNLDHEQRAEFMKQKVVPALEQIFKKHDAQKYAEFGCKTCHGKGADQGHFDLPNMDLPLIGMDAMQKFKPEQLEWMVKEVKPTMAKLLGQPEWTPQNPTGFGCGGCHPHAKS